MANSKDEALLFGCSVDNVSLHLKNIFKDGELEENAVVEKFSVTAYDGKQYNTKHYNLDAKGDHLENTESKQKVKLGRAWQHQAGNQYRYYMVFEDKNLNLEGAYQFEKFMEIIRNL